MLAAAGYLVSTHIQPVQAAAEPAPLVAKGNVRTGTLNRDPEKHQKELNQVVKENVLVFSINTTPFMNSGASTANLLIENLSGNGK